MMGQLDGGTAKLFYEFSLEEMVPQNHLLRKIDRFLDFDDLREHLKPFYSHTGRPKPVMVGSVKVISFVSCLNKLFCAV